MKRLPTLCAVLALMAGFSQLAHGAEKPAIRHFLTARGDQLFDGDQPFRFVSFNIPNLHLIEDHFSFTNPNPWRWPNEFEIDDALESVRQMGGTVVRTYVLSVRREGSDMGEHVHVRGPGDFNEEAFRVLDKVLQLAGKKGIRVIIPLVDNWQWWGGTAEYAQFRGMPPEAFWSDEQVIRDFEQTIRFTLSRVNSFTGKPYKDDPTIFGWETGNELDSTPEWTRRIAACIKKNDPRHLVIDGFALHGVRQESLADPNIDVITTHHYPNTDTDYVQPILRARAATAGKKPYFVGEFGFIPEPEIRKVLDTVIEQGVSGALLWSLRFHNRDGGFYWHDEPAGGDHFKAYHWPGFPSGALYQETAVLKLVKQEAYRIRGLPAPPVARPAAPLLLPIEHPGRIAWQGSAGASRYEVLRAEKESGPWQTVGKNISDAAVQYRPLFCDTNIQTNRPYFYRVVAKNEAGNSNSSNTVGPVTPAYLLLVDELADQSLLHSTAGMVRQRSDRARQTQEDIHRLELQPGGQVTYQVPQSIQGVRAFLFGSTKNPRCELTVSTDGEVYQPVQVNLSSPEQDAGKYDYLQPVLLEATLPDKAAKFVRLTNSAATTADAADAFQISRVEIVHGAANDSPR